MPIPKLTVHAVGAVSLGVAPGVMPARPAAAWPRPQKSIVERRVPEVAILGMPLIQNVGSNELMFRLLGPSEALFNKSWLLPAVEKVE